MFVSMERHPRTLAARFSSPAVCYSTDLGRREDLVAVYNHQVCEPVDHALYVGEYLSTTAEHQLVCDQLGTTKVAGMVTAANMNCAGVATKVFREARILAVATAGVEGNACRAGDPTTYCEWDGQWAPVGTINVMLFYSHPVKDGELFRALMTATEAKAALLADLHVGSRYSSRFATGTGTDQFIVACPQGTPRITDLGKHSKLGELTAHAVRDAIAAALALQNDLTPQSRRSVLALVRRFGVTKQQLLADVKQALPKREAELFEKNLPVIDTDPLTVAAVAAFTTTLDMIEQDIIPNVVREEALSLATQHLASAAAGFPVSGPTQPTVGHALALGWAAKWESTNRHAQL